MLPYRAEFSLAGLNLPGLPAPCARGYTLIVLGCSKCGGVAHYEYNMKAIGNRKRCSKGGEPEGIGCWMCT